MKVLITGINGFVGRILSKIFISRGHEVYGIDIQGNNSNISAGDITDPESIIRITGEIGPDIIVHLAAISKVDFKNPSLLYKINVTGTLNVLTAAVNCRKIPSFLYVSSSQVYGIVNESEQPINEDMPVNPVNNYGASKAAGECICRAFMNEYEMPLVIVRPFNHIGLGQDPHFVVPKIVQGFKEKKPYLELGNIETERDFLDVRDVADAYIRIIENFKSGSTYNISSGCGIKISDIISKLENLIDEKIEIKKGDDFIRKNEIKKSIGSSGKIKTDLGWRKKYSINDTLKWMLEN